MEPEVPPSHMCPRTYEMRGRRLAAEATRSKILEATRLLVGGRGDLQEFSMEAVAKRAGVARMTVYNQFDSRADLLEALADHLAQRGGMQRMREVFVEPDPEVALQRLVEVFVQFWASDRVTLRRLRALGVVSPSEDRGPRERDQWRRQAIEVLLGRGKRRPASGKPRSSEGLAALLTSLTSFETFDALCTDGRSPEDVAVLLGKAALVLVQSA